MAESREAEGLLASLKTLTLTLVDVVQTRLELLSTDVAEERAHLTTILISAMVALFCLGVGVMLLATFIVVLFWESHRLLTLGVLTAIFLGSGAGLWVVAMHKLRNKPRLFDASISELAKDREQLSSGSE
jgi:uncharacterized membrane protein YqjE